MKSAYPGAPRKVPFSPLPLPPRFRHLLSGPHRSACSFRDTLLWGPGLSRLHCRPSQLIPQRPRMTEARTSGMKWNIQVRPEQRVHMAGAGARGSLETRRQAGHCSHFGRENRDLPPTPSRLGGPCGVCGCGARTGALTPERMRRGRGAARRPREWEAAGDVFALPAEWMERENAPESCAHSQGAPVTRTPDAEAKTFSLAQDPASSGGSISSGGRDFEATPPVTGGETEAASACLDRPPGRRGPPCPLSPLPPKHSVPVQNCRSHASNTKLSLPT